MTADAGLERLPVLVHELRSPVAALAAISTVLGDSSVDSTERRALTELALAACRGIERIVGDAAVSSVRLEEVDPARLAREAVAAVELVGADVRTEVASSSRVTADPVRLRQALDNLIANAVRHAPGGQVVVAVTDGDGVVELSVSDDGPGIAAADLERVFEPGTRLDADRAGSGLGLALARAIAAAHGGTLTVTSAPGHGTTFKLALPAGARD